MTDQKRRVLILVPGEKGGIARLFAHLGATESVTDATVEVELFVSHGNLFTGIALFPIRLARFLMLGLIGHFDLCHINLSLKGSTVRKIIFAKLCRLLRIPYLIHLHGAPFEDFYDNLPEFGKSQVARLFVQATRVLVLGTHFRKFAITELGVDPARVLVLPNAVTGPELPVNAADKEQPPRILFIGEVGNRKGAPELAQALASPSLAAMDWTATIAGDGEVEKYRAIIRDAGLHDRVDVPGWVGPGEVQRLLERASILALPSHAENQPLSMLEGMAFGACPVVTPVGEVEDVIRDGENGILVPVGDAGALADALAGLLVEPTLRTQIAERARCDFEAGYDIRDYREKLEMIYCDALDQP